MKYMTCDLLARTQSEDEEIADAALVEWEKSCENYNRRIQTIRPKLPKSVQSLLDDLCLHDSRLITLGKDQNHADENSFFIDLQLPGNQGLRLNYALTGLNIELHSQDHNNEVELLWLYDEIDVVEMNSPEVGAVFVFTHSVLLTEGVELQLRFHSLSLTRYEKMLSPVKRSHVEEQLIQS